MLHTITKILLLFLLFFVSTYVHALSCVPRNYTLQQAYDEADSIIVGMIVMCEIEVSDSPWTSGGENCTFSPMEVLKEATPQRDYTGVASSSGCGLSLTVGEQYLLFLDNENRPLRFSAQLRQSRERYNLAGAGDYLKILRDHRDRSDKDLSEPWFFSDSNGTCTLAQSLGMEMLTFTKQTARAPETPQLSWTQQVQDGTTVYKTGNNAEIVSNSMGFYGSEVIAYGPDPSTAANALTFRAAPFENSPIPLRRATISVGSRTWPLYRLEFIMRRSAGGRLLNKIARYYTAGNSAEEILDAMRAPTDIVVRAVLVEPADDSPATESPPELRLDSRSTRLGPALDQFQSCIAEE